MKITICRLLPVKGKPFSKTSVKYLRKTENGWKVTTKNKHELHEKETVAAATQTDNKAEAYTNNKSESAEINNKFQSNSKYRENEMKIQMLSSSLYNQIFKTSPVKAVDPALVTK